MSEPTDEDVVTTAAQAAEGVIFANYSQSDVRDLDVTVRFEEGILEVDVYLNAPDDPDPEAVVDEAIAAAESAVDELFE
ncbi:MAG: DUF3194 domain-containing protein [Halobacteriota archaeon]